MTCENLGLERLKSLGDSIRVMVRQAKHFWIELFSQYPHRHFRIVMSFAAERTAEVGSFRN